MPALHDPPTRQRPGLRGVARGLVELAIPQRLLVRHGDPARRQVALTFDDGPDVQTGPYLDVLQRLGVPATFFLVGMFIERLPQVTCEYQRRGHQIAFHGHTHKRFTKLPTAALWAELTRAQAVLQAAGAQPCPRLLRPPYGNLDLRSMALCHAAGYRPVMWSVDSQDWRIHDAQRLVKHIRMQHLRGGEIILMHERQPWTLEALPGIVTAIRERGLTPVTLSELLRAA